VGIEWNLIKLISHRKEDGKMEKRLISSEQIINGDLVEKFLASLDIKPQSKVTYRKALKQYFNYIKSNPGLKFNRSCVIEYKAYLISIYSACTVSSYLTAVKEFYKFLEAEKICPNIAIGIKGLKCQRGSLKDALTINQVKCVLEKSGQKNIDEKRNYALINLLIRTGLRTIEAERANIEDIKQECGDAILFIQGKGRDQKDSFVVLTEATYEPIREYINFRNNAQPSDPLFVSHSNRNSDGRLTTRSISRIVKTAFIEVGLNSKRLTAHSTRHTAITLALLGGATIQEAQSFARHQNINTTLIYAHNINRILHAPERKVDALLASGQ